MATIKDVAKLAEVSVATVSRVVNKTGYVKKETEKRVREAINLLGFEPNVVARGLSNKSSGTIALILPDIKNPFFPEIARAVEDIAQANGFTVLLCNSDDQSSKEKLYVNVLRQRYVDGIIFASNTLRSEDIDQMQRDNIPLIVLDRAPANGSCSVIRSKNREGARLAVKHLFEAGCLKIAHIYGPLELITANERLKGYEDFISDHPDQLNGIIIPGDFTIRGGIEATKKLMKKDPGVDGIFAGNDLMAIGALKALREMGIKVPHDIAVCGFDGIGMTEITEPELTTIAQPIYEMGKLATEILIQKIRGILPENKIYELEVSLKQRKSTLKDSIKPF